MTTVANKPGQDREVDSRQIERLINRIKTLEEEKRLIQKGRTDQATAIEDIIKVVAGVASALVALSFIFYIMGYHIVSDFYSLFGLRVYDVNKPVFLSAGVSFVLVNVLPMVSSLVLTIAIKIIYAKQFGPQLMNVLSWVLFPFLFIYINWTYATWVYDLTGGQFSYFENLCVLSNNLDCEPSFDLFLGLSVFSAFLITRILNNNRELTINFFIMFGIYLLFILSFMFDWWGENVYPNIIPAFAGGKPSGIQLMISADAPAEQLTVFDIPVNQYVTADVLLIDEGPDFITVVNESCNAVKISKSFFVNILYKKENNEINPLFQKCILGNSGAELLPP